jgi:hypothetical protein
MTCKHPPTALRAWFARDDSQPTGKQLVIACIQCQTVLQGGFTDETHNPAPHHLPTMQRRIRTTNAQARTRAAGNASQDRHL